MKTNLLKLGTFMNLKGLLMNSRRSMLLAVYGVTLSYPVTMFIYKGVRSQYFAVLFLLSIYGFITRKIRIKDYPVDKLEFLFLLSAALISLIAWVSYAYFGFQDVARHRVEKYTWFIFVVPVYYLFRFTRPRMEVVWLGIVLGCTVAFGRALLEEFSLVNDLAWADGPRWNRGPGFRRANGVMHPIRFGDLSLLMGFISLVGTLYLKDLKPYLKVLGLFGFFSGVGASIMSQSRGGWIVAPVLAFIILKKVCEGKSRKFNLILLFGVFLSLSSIAFVPQLNKIANRFESAWSDIVKYKYKGDSQSSIGVRLNMFETALYIFEQHPFFGVGVGNYNKFAKQYYQRNPLALSKNVILWKNPHNEFLLQMATRGVIGLISILFMFLVFFYYFYKKRSQRDVVYDFPSFSGMFIIVSYIFFGFSIALFEHRDFLMFFIIYVFLFASSLNSMKNRSNSVE